MAGLNVTKEGPEKEKTKISFRSHFEKITGIEFTSTRSRYVVATETLTEHVV
jgi:hypothetical protein